jgi:hypothetical protein
LYVLNDASSGLGYGIFSRTWASSFGAAGVRGENLASSGQVIGVEGVSPNGDAGTGIVGRGSATGGYFESFGPAGGFTSTGVYTLSSEMGVYAETSGITAGRFNAFSPADAIYATTSGSGVGIAGRFEDNADFGKAMYAYSLRGLALQGVSSTASAIRGESYGTGDHIGVYGQQTSSASQFAWGVFAAGRLGANGTKLFQIDHPLDPENKVLQHYCAEGDAPRLSYSGHVTLDAKGEAWVQLPDYFEEINRDPEYQLTCVGGYAQVFVAEEIKNHRFKIAGGRPGLKVSWRVEGIRNDRFVRKFGCETEIEKPDEMKGKFISPELFGMPAEKGIYYAAPPLPSPEVKLAGKRK